MIAPHIPVTGGCLCGAVRYKSSVAPTEGYYCHCRICQRHYGNLSGATVRFAGPTFRHTNGSPRLYRSSEIAQRSFCPDCGTPIAFIYNSTPDLWVSIGSLDHPEDWPLTGKATWGPVTHLQVDSKIPWNDIDDGLPQHTSETAFLQQAALAALAEKKV